jgi:hypothetical protein
MTSRIAFHLSMLFWAALVNSHAQVFTVDQASKKDGQYLSGAPNGYLMAFTPSAPAIGFLDLFLADDSPNDGKGTSVSVLLRRDTFNGPIVGETGTLNLPDKFPTGFKSFLFSRNILIRPEQVYFLEIRYTGSALDSFFAFYPRGGRLDSSYRFRTNEVILFREGVVQPKITSLKTEGSKSTVSWEGVGVLQVATHPSGPWLEFPDKMSGQESIDVASYGWSSLT